MLIVVLTKYVFVTSAAHPSSSQHERNNNDSSNNEHSIWAQLQRNQYGLIVLKKVTTSYLSSIDYVGDSCYNVLCSLNRAFAGNRLAHASSCHHCIYKIESPICRNTDAHFYRWCKNIVRKVNLCFGRDCPSYMFSSHQFLPIFVGFGGLPLATPPRNTAHILGLEPFSRSRSWTQGRAEGCWPIQMVESQMVSLRPPFVFTIPWACVAQIHHGYSDGFPVDVIFVN